MPDPTTKDRLALGEKHNRAMRRVRIATFIYRFWLVTSPVTVAAAMGLIPHVHLHWLVPTVQIFLIIPMLSAIGFYRELAASTRERLLTRGNDLACLRCWYPAPENTGERFRCPECGAYWSTQTVRDYLTPPVSYAHIPNPLSETPADA